jgi:hypothetical protein
MKPTTGTLALEQQLREANEQIRQLEHEAADKKELADKRVAELKETGQNPLINKELFTEVDELYKEADLPAQQASEIRERADELMQRLASRSNGTQKRERIMG